MASTRSDQNGDSFDNTQVQKLLSPDSNDFGEAEVSPRFPSNSYDAVDTFGEPEILPQIGDEYQVELPQLIGESDSITYRETRDDANQKFVVGLPITLTWICSEERDIVGSRSSSRTRLDFTHSDAKNMNKMELEPSHDSRKSMEESQNFPTSEKICKRSGLGYHPIPGLCDENWTAAEKDCFLLGLYIFEKNFVEVKRFVGTKEMGALQSYYYGKFYRSPEYCRWSECRKMKRKKGIFGQRLFSGLRQQELLSRILPKVSEECRNAILEVSKRFVDEKMSLAEYVFSLKATVGTAILVEAVAIGKGKQDLTGMASDPSRSNQVVHMRPEIPTGKACSSLTIAEIIKFLSGDYRLSKARSSDLFWEAVWPRLLARGWHSEQPENQGYSAASKQCLVFLMPGIKKFSRRKLTKGDQYFDSVTDVLSRVAREPGLIELDTEVDGGNSKEEYERSGERKSEENDDDLPTSQRRFYLQPRMPNRSSVELKFTVVDTSLSDGRVRELRTLPSEISNAFTAPYHSEDSESDANDTIMPDALATDVSPETAAKSDEEILPDISAAISLPEENKKDLQEDTRYRKAPESPLSRKHEQENEEYTAPTTKRLRILVGRSQEQPTVENGKSDHCSDNHEVNEHLLSRVSLCLDKLPSTSSSRDSENPRTHMSFDLNLPQLPPDSADGFFGRDLNNEQDVTSNEPDDHGVPNSDIQAGIEEQSNSNPRRHSTRIRPLTTKAIEAVAHGYLTVNRRRKRKETSSDDGQ